MQVAVWLLSSFKFQRNTKNNDADMMPKQGHVDDDLAFYDDDGICMRG